MGATVSTRQPGGITLKPAFDPTAHTAGIPKPPALEPVAAVNLANRAGQCQSDSGRQSWTASMCW